MKNYFKITSEIYHWIMRFKVFLKKDDKEFDEVIRETIFQIISEEKYSFSDSKTLSLINMVNKVAKTDVTVFIHGPTGTGKEVISESEEASEESPKEKKPKKRGNRWPTNALAPARATVSGTSDSQRATSTDNTPLRTSPARVSPAPTLLPRRSTLVAPGFPEPSERGSGSCIARDTRTALETEPSKYPAIAKIRYSMRGAGGWVSRG